MEVRIIEKKLGILYVVATPIGNLEDITYRALRTLSEVDLILCEDTRRTVKLLNHYEIKKPLESYHSFNEARKSLKLIQKLKNGENLALVSDAGTPCISDPGYLIVSKALEEGLDVVPIPGASAFVSLLSVSGFPLKEFLFLGFLPPKKSKRVKKLSEFVNFNGVIIVYESPFRIFKLLEEIKEVFPKSDVLLGRELTKIYEEFYRGKADELINQGDKLKKKGEYTILINNFIKG